METNAKEMQKESEALSNLRREVLNGRSLIGVAKIVKEIPKEDYVRALIICQETPDVEVWTGVNELFCNVGIDLIMSNIEILLAGRTSQNNRVRFFCQTKLEKLNSEQLASKNKVLFDSLNSRFSLIRYYGEELLLKIKEPDLCKIFSDVCQEYLLNGCDVKRVAARLLVNTMHNWKVEDYCANFYLLKKLQSSKDRELQELADLNVLLAMGIWPIDKIKAEWDFLSRCRNSENEKIFREASLLTFRLMNNWEFVAIEKDIDFICDSRHYYNNETRQLSREFALSILTKWENPERIFEKRNFLVTCLKSKTFSVRHRAKIILGKVPAEMFARDIETFIKWHAMASPRISAAIRKVLFKIPSEYFADHLSLLMETQKYNDVDHCRLGYELASRINRKALLQHKEMISEMSCSKDKKISKLANELMFLVI